jgi:aldose 1-epimerase
MQHIVLEAHDLTAEILPQIGGMVKSLAWRHAGRDHALLHPATATPRTDSTAERHGLWPLMPFANRAFGARLLHDGGSLALPVNDAGDGSTMHGFGWQAAWQVAEHKLDHVLLRHAYARADPYAYEAEFGVRLDPGEARFSLAVRNTGLRALPFGIGLHPWFPRNAQTRLRCTASGALRFGDRYRATGIGPVMSADDFSSGRTLPPETAVSYLGWDGVAELSDIAPGLNLTIRASDTMRHPVLWTPEGAPFVCFEPQSHAIGAPSEPVVAAATPLTLLAPGETLAGWMALEPTATMENDRP